MNIIEQYKTMSGKWCYRVEIDSEESAFFTFAEEPTTEQLAREVEIYSLRKQLATLTNQPVEQPEDTRVQKITPRQFRQALIRVGLYDQVLAMMPEMPLEVQVDWEYAIEIDRAYPVWDQMAPMLGKTSEDVDAIFQLGASIV